MSEAAKRVGLRGIQNETLKNVFVVVAFLILVGSLVLDQLSLTPFGVWLHSDRLNLLTFLIGFEIPLWFAQILIWSRGTDLFTRYETRVLDTLNTLEQLGFTMELLEPALDAVKDRLAHFTDQERENLKLMLYVLAGEQLKKYEDRLAAMNTEALRDYVAGKRADAVKAQAPKPEL